MRIFLTGATGYVGSAVLDALIRGGHDVTTLVRDNEKAAHMAARGARPVVGNLADPKSFRAVADAQEGYVHAALDTATGKGPETEKIALETVIAGEVKRLGIVESKVPKISKSFDEISNMNFTPNEGFLLSRINGQWDVGSIMKVSPMREIDALLIFHRLFKDGIIHF